MGKQKNTRSKVTSTTKTSQSKNKPNDLKIDHKSLIQNLISSDTIYLKLLIFLFPFFYGLFYDFTALLAGVFLCVTLLFLIIRRKQFLFSTSIPSLLLIFIFFSYLIVSIWSVDQGMAVLGFMKFSPCIIFLIILMQLSRSEIIDCFSVIPWSGVIMVLVSAFTYFVPDLAVYFFDAGRLGGFFQYANTFALFLLIGIIVTVHSKEATPIEIFKLVILTFGVLLTGSRISLILLFCLFIYFFIFFKPLRKSIGLIAGSLFLLVIFFVSATGNLGSIGRITTIFSESSTFVGRFLYDIDAFRLLWNHPFGIGYMSYYYLQPQIQTGVYITRFVHNEFLQLGLDAGVLSLVAFAFVCFKSFFSIKITSMEKIILGTVLLHAFFDFDFQYLIVLFILLMTLDLGESKILTGKSLLLGTKLGLIILSGLYGFASLGLYLGHLGYPKESIKMIPFNTEMKISILSKAQTQEEIEYWSEAVLSTNDTIALAYEGKAVVAIENDDYESMVANMQKVVLNSKYNIKAYEKYLVVLEKAMNHYNEEGDRENLMKYSNIALAIPDQLDQVISETSPLAYMINDQPNLQLSEPYVNYLAELRKSLPDQVSH